jgi:hypothetical protein
LHWSRSRSAFDRPGALGRKKIRIKEFKGAIVEAQSGSSEMYARGAGTDAAETQRSGISWGAVFAGAAAAAALSLVLFILGSGLGLAAISPWSYHSAAAIGVSTILWISFTQLAASAVGGYMAGRLRTKWVSVQTRYSCEVLHGHA